MKKISTEDEKAIVLLLRKWPVRERLTWDALREAIATTSTSREKAWSRQSLSANDDIRTAFLVAKRRLAEVPSASAGGSESELSQKIIGLESELGELKLKYDRLLVRHSQLVYNASLLDGGSHLLDPLPDNTNSQRG